MQISPELLALIQAEATKAAEAVYAKKGTMYGVADVPAHSHNNIDSQQLTTSAVSGFNNLSSQEGGVLSPANIGSRTVVWNQALIGAGSVVGLRGVFPTFPIVTIFSPDGEALTFQGGDAPVGTMIMYKLPDQPQVWWRWYGGWYGIGINLNTAKTVPLGPVA